MLLFLAHAASQKVKGEKSKASGRERGAAMGGRAKGAGKRKTGIRPAGQQQKIGRKSTRRSHVATSRADGVGLTAASDKDVNWRAAALPRPWPGTALPSRRARAQTAPRVAMGAFAPFVVAMAICGILACSEAVPGPLRDPNARVRGAVLSRRAEQARTRVPRAQEPPLGAALLEEGARARFLPSTLGGGKDAAPETEPLPDKSTLEAFVDSNNAHQDTTTANTCSVCVSIATKHLSGSEDNGLYCLGSKKMGSQQVVSRRRPRLWRAARVDIARWVSGRCDSIRGCAGSDCCLLPRSAFKRFWESTGGSTRSRTGAPTVAE